MKRTTILFVVTLLVVLDTAWTNEKNIFVSPAGRDDAPGTQSQPLATVQEAQLRARALRQDPQNRVTIFFRGGDYVLNQSVEFTEEDSGTPEHPLLYSAFRNEQVRLIGGRLLPETTRVTDANVLQVLSVEARRHVHQVDLRRYGIADFGQLSARGFGRAIQPSALELFVNDAPMVLARWPNGEWTTISDTLPGQRQQAFIFRNDRMRNWLGRTDVWLHGYWTWDWADSYEKVDTLDLARQRIVTRPPGGVYGYAPDKRFYALNILQELDAAGEYYVDREAGMLYFWPPDHHPVRRICVSLLEQPLLHLKNTQHLVIQGLTLDCSRGAGVVIEGGHHNLLQRCTIRNIGTVGACIGTWNPDIGGEIYRNTLYNSNGGSHNGVQNCHIYNCGEGGVILSGGDRSTLTPAHNFVDHCDIHDCCLWVNTYRAGVFMWGVGNRLSHSLIHNLPHTAVFFWGNDHVMEYNETHHVCLQTGDAGAFYLGRDWTQRGSLIRYNYFHDLPVHTVGKGFVDVMAIYLDDWASGTTIFGNVFVRCGRSIMIGGGRDNVVENNLVVSGRPALHVDARGIGWASYYFNGEDNVLFSRLAAVKPEMPPYSERYPALKTILQNEPALPKGNRIARNIICGGRYRELLDKVDENLVSFEHNAVSDSETGVTIKDRVLHIDPALVRQSEFQPIPFEKTGLSNQPAQP